MNFRDAIKNQDARTQNNMKARKSTANACVDLFFKIGASRGKDIIPEFVAAYVENKDIALRILQWARDVRGGAGERQLFKDILSYLERTDEEAAITLINKIPEIGRWDDMLINYYNKNVEKYAFNKIKIALINKDGLCAKWMPRKGLMAVKLRNALDMTPKQYRKTLVRLSDTVEQKMCAKQWNSIDFNKVPSLAHSRYRSAFMRNAEANFNRYMEKVKKGEAKINAGAVYPYDVVKNINMYMLKTERDHIVAQWNALEDFVGDAKVFPMIDVSGSMYSNVGKNLTCMGIAVSLGLYFADKNKGAFKDCFLTFSENPEIQYVRGDIVKKYNQVKESDWGFNTNLHRAFDAILHLAVSKNVPEKYMPETLIIFSDMQFDQCVEFDDTAFEMIKRKYNKAGYNIPNIVFWNINAYDNVPVKFNESGVALVSGFSPSVAKAILHGNLDELTPENVMLKTVMVPRYDL